MFSIRQERLFSLEEILEMSPKKSYPLIFDTLDITSLLRVVSKRAILGAPTRLNYSAMIYSFIHSSHRTNSYDLKTYEND
ncbi:hypothetical protein DEAC_c05560 [Desulfosporosinus acididurans]|uniref:Transposase InsH N-terminal domain-containing protein n=1 Tax=Desulfosporosinus acididurans TaxID=476652 RepID=A0A0J1FV75_9FIRM|nr:hypothetical protein DEAC_c05560 [Desulfosporosinus acididurans]